MEGKIADSKGCIDTYRSIKGILKSLSKNMTRPTSYKSMSVDSKTC